MEQKIKELSDMEVVRIYERLKNVEPGSKEYTDMLDNLTLLQSKRIEEAKMERDFIVKTDERIIKEREQNDKKAQADKELKTRWVEIGLRSAGGVAMFIGYVWLNLTHMRFEEKGVLSSQVGRRLINATERFWTKK